MLQQEGGSVRECGLARSGEYEEVCSSKKCALAGGRGYEDHKVGESDQT